MRVTLQRRGGPQDSAHPTSLAKTEKDLLDSPGPSDHLWSSTAPTFTSHEECQTMKRSCAYLAGLIALSSGMVFAQYGDLGDLKIQKPQDKEHFKSTPPPDGAIVLFDGKGLDGWTKRDGKSEPTWKLVDGAAMEV